MLSADAKEKLQAWAKDKRPYFVGVDVGATNVRVALSRDVPVTLDYFTVVKFECHSADKLVETFEKVGKECIDILSYSPLSACIGVAGPVENGEKVRITNYTTHQTIHVKDLPKTLFPVNRTHMINDLASTCYGIIALSNMKKLNEFFQPVWSSKETLENGQSLASQSYVVLAAGTGLGTASLLPSSLFTFITDRAPRTSHHVLPLEYGHTTITPLGFDDPGKETENSLFRYLSQKNWGGKHSPEWEDICSGRGLVSCYSFFAENEKVKDAAEVAKKSEEGEEKAVQAALTHYEYLLRAAATLCTALQAKGVLLAGGNQVKNSKFVSHHRDQLYNTFTNTSKQEWLTPVNVCQQVVDINLNLLGCVAAAEIKEQGAKEST